MSRYGKHFVTLVFTKDSLNGAGGQEVMSTAAYQVSYYL